MSDEIDASVDAVTAESEPIMATVARYGPVAMKGRCWTDVDADVAIAARATTMSRGWVSRGWWLW